MTPAEMRSTVEALCEAVEHVLRCIPIGGYAQIHYDSATQAQMLAAADRGRALLSALPSERPNMAELDAEADAIAEAAYSADYDAAPAIRALVRRALGQPLETNRDCPGWHPDGATCNKPGCMPGPIKEKP